MQHIANKGLTKKCSKCKEEKSLDSFGVDGGAKDGKFYWCSDCSRDHSRAYNKANKKKRKADALARYHRNAKDPEFRARRNARQREYAKEYTKRPETREKQAKWTKKYLSNTRNKISRRISFQIWSSMRGQLDGNPKANRHWELLVDFTLDELMAHLEARFEDGMTWETYGGDSGWQIDHITPRTWFEFESEDSGGFRECWALENLQPKWLADNASKGNRYAG